MFTKEEREVLSNAAYNRASRLIVDHRGEYAGSSRTAVYWSNYSGVSMLKLNLLDGRTKMFWLEARFGQYDWRRRNLEDRSVLVTAEVSYSESEEFWQPRVEKYKLNPDRHLIVNHKWYSIGTEDPSARAGGGGGFGGREIQFRRILNDGTPPESSDARVLHELTVPTQFPGLLGPVMVTHNLWYGGVIPPSFRGLLPDNAVFLNDFDGPVLMP